MVNVGRVCSEACSQGSDKCDYCLGQPWPCLITNISNIQLVDITLSNILETVRPDLVSCIYTIIPNNKLSSYRNNPYTEHIDVYAEGATRTTENCDPINFSSDTAWIYSILKYTARPKITTLYKFLGLSANLFHENQITDIVVFCNRDSVYIAPHTDKTNNILFTLSGHRLFFSSFEIPANPSSKKVTQHLPSIKSQGKYKCITLEVGTGIFIRQGQPHAVMAWGGGLSVNVGFN
jgi:hypothetical protein